MTYSEIKSLFRTYNDKYFNGELTCSIELSHTRRVKRRYGDFSPRRNRIRIFSHTHGKTTTAMWKGTIIHEMVHAILAKRFGNRNCGHNRNFHAILGSAFRTEFGIRYTRNRFVQKDLERITDNKVTPTPTPTPRKVIPTTPVPISAMYRVLSTGKVGAFLKESTVYGKRHLTLKIEGMLFPFTVPADQAVAV